MFRRFQRWLSEFLGISSTEPEEVSAEAVLAQYEEGFRQRIASFDQALAAREALRDLLKTQIRELELEQKQLAGELDRGGANPSDHQVEVALRWEACSNELRDLHDQLADAQKSSAALAAEREDVIAEARRKLLELADSLGKERIARVLASLGTGKPPGRVEFK